MRVFYLKNWNDTTNNRINGNVQVKQRDRNCSDLEKKKKSFLGYRCVLKILLGENVRHYHRRKEMQRFLVSNVCLCNIKEDEANI